MERSKFNGRGMAFMAQRDGWDLAKSTFETIPRLTIRRFFLGDGSVERGGTFWVYDNVSDCAKDMREKLMQVKGVAVYVRDLAPEARYF